MGIEIGLRHSGYIESIITIGESRKEERRGLRVRVIARRKWLKRTLGDDKGEDVIYFRLCLSGYFSKNHMRKEREGRGGGERRKG